MSSYKECQWEIFRQSIIELDNFKCTKCGRSKDEVVLQVHHKLYKPDLKAWEYATSDCITLCKGCHAEIHGKIHPKFGWEYLGEEDLEDLIGICDNCGSAMRYSFTIFHDEWGTMHVGTVCCDNLTDTKIASNFKESSLKFESRQKRFIDSKRWKSKEGIHKIEQGLFKIEILEIDHQYSLKVNKKSSKIKHSSLIAAKEKVFEIIENGALMKYFKDIDFDFDTLKKKKRKKEKI